MEAKAKADAVQAVVDAMKGDRHSFMAAIKAQQQVVEEQSSAVRRYAAERRDAERKSTNLERQAMSRDEDLKVMNETLREYQSASTEFVYENHSIHRELERLRRQNNEIRGSMTSMSPMRSSTPTRTTRGAAIGAASPLNSTAMSPYSQSSNGGSVQRHRDPAIRR
jgi:chromosome segregation ATPase